MFNVNTIKDMSTIDEIVSAKSEELFKQDKRYFLVWTFPTNHLHKHEVESSNYFVVWCGITGHEVLKRVCFASIVKIPELIKDLTVFDIEYIFNR